MITQAWQWVLDNQPLFWQAVWQHLTMCGLGSIILAGLDQRYPEKIFIGGGLTSLLAIGADLFFVRLQRRISQGRSQ